MDLILMALGTIYMIGWSVFWLACIGLFFWILFKFIGVIFKFTMYGIFAAIGFFSVLSILTWSFI
jgi:hypothetical protein